MSIEANRVALEELAQISGSISPDTHRCVQSVSRPSATTNPGNGEIGRIVGADEAPEAYLNVYQSYLTAATRTTAEIFGDNPSFLEDATKDLAVEFYESEQAGDVVEVSRWTVYDYVNNVSIRMTEYTCQLTSPNLETTSIFWTMADDEIIQFGKFIGTRLYSDGEFKSEHALEGIISTIESELDPFDVENLYESVLTEVTACYQAILNSPEDLDEALDRYMTFVDKLDEAKKYPSNLGEKLKFTLLPVLVEEAKADRSEALANHSVPTAEDIHQIIKIINALKK